MFSPIYNPRQPVNLHVDPNGFRVEGWGAAVDVGLDQIERVEVYKRDLMTEDQICMDIWLDRTAPSPGPVSIHEDMPGFDDVLEGLERLRGFDLQWRERVLQPAFAENRTLVYERG
jgi:hypothetical protein